MNITKYAVRNVMRTKGRSILLGIIITIIAFSLCIGLCIRQSSASSMETALEGMTITAQISPDRQAAMEKAMGGTPGEAGVSGSDGSAAEPGQGFDKDALKSMMGTSLTLEEMQTYATAESVQSFYYTMTSYANASGDLEAYDTSDDVSGDSGMSGSKGGKASMPGMSSGDFVITGYSSDEAMTEFVEGTCTIEDGAVFEAGTSDKVCIISDELAAYNDLEVGDKITVCSTDDEDETVKLEIVGIYSNSQASAQASGFGGMGGRSMSMADPANYIYVSYNTLAAIAEDSEGFSGTVEGTYVLADYESYEAFQEEVVELGLSDEYTVSSSDVTAYEQSAEPLENLAKFAGYFLIVIMVIGAVIMVVLNIFATRERKYEIGVLAAIGMKKKKVAQLFITEILIITLLGVVVGGGIGAAVSVPVTNALLSTQVAAQEEQAMGRDSAFGREFGGAGEMPDKPGDMAGESSDSIDSIDGSGDSGTSAEKPVNPVSQYMTQVSSSVNLTVLLQLLACCILLAMAGGIVSVAAIMRYEPSQILSERD